MGLLYGHAGLQEKAFEPTGCDLTEDGATAGDIYI